MNKRRVPRILPELEEVAKIKDIFVIRKVTEDAICTRCRLEEVIIKMKSLNTKGLHVHANSIHNIFQRKKKEPTKTLGKLLSN